MTFVESAHIFNDLAPPPDFSARWRQCFQQPAAVALRHDARVGDDDDAAVGAAANESAETLLETKRRVRQHVLDEGIAALSDDRLAMRGGDRLGRDAKGELRDEQRTKRLTGNVDALPEGSGAEENGTPRLAEAREERVAAILAVHEQRPASIGSARTKLRRHRAHDAVAREENEHAAIRRRREIECQSRRGELMAACVHVRRRTVRRDGETVTERVPCAARHRPQ